MKEDLMRQMEQHRQAKREEKKHDMEYFEAIVRQKDEVAKEEREKREALLSKVHEQKLVRDQQISEHNRLKKLKSREKREEHERLRQQEKELAEQVKREKDNLKH